MQPPELGQIVAIPQVGGFITDTNAAKPETRTQRPRSMCEATRVFGRFFPGSTAGLPEPHP